MSFFYRRKLEFFLEFLAQIFSLSFIFLAASVIKSLVWLRDHIYLQSRRNWNFDLLNWFQIYSGLLSRIHPICKAMGLVNTHPLLILKVLWRLLRLNWTVSIWSCPGATPFWSSFSVPGCPMKVGFVCSLRIFFSPLGATSAIVHHPPSLVFSP